MIVLDTHVLIWLVAAPERIGRNAMEALEQAASAERIHVPAITPWEIAMSVGKGRIHLGAPLTTWIESALQQPGIRVAPLDSETAIDAGTLPGDIHGDPADRMIVATARALGCPLLTADRKILAYAAAGHVRAIDARR